MGCRNALQRGRERPVPLVPSSMFPNAPAPAPRPRPRGEAELTAPPVLSPPPGAFGVLRDSGLRVPEIHKEGKVGEGRGGGGGEGYFGGLGDTHKPPSRPAEHRQTRCMSRVVVYKSTRTPARLGGGRARLRKGGKGTGGRGKNGGEKKKIYIPPRSWAKSQGFSPLFPESPGGAEPSPRRCQGVKFRAAPPGSFENKLRMKEAPGAPPWLSRS